MVFKTLLFLGLLILPCSQIACMGDDEEEDPVVVTAGDVRERFDMLLCVFENDDPSPDYATTVNLNDGRGYTCGWVGLTSSEAELADLVRSYTAQVPGNPLAPYQATLNNLAATGSDDVSGLAGFPVAWAAAAADAVFQDQYDGVVDDLYFNPAMLYMGYYGFTTNLTKFILYDAIVQHGEGDDPDGLPAMITRTNALVAPSAATEQTWCSTFLTIREATLTNPANVDTKDAWNASLPRIEIQRRLLAAGNWPFNGPLEIDYYYTPCTIN